MSRKRVFLSFAVLALIGIAITAPLAEDYDKEKKVMSMPDKAVSMEDCVAHKAVADFHRSMKSVGVIPAAVKLENGTEDIVSSDDPKIVDKIHLATDTREATIRGIKGMEELCRDCQAFMMKMKEGKLSRQSVKFDKGAFVLLTSSDEDIIKHLHDKFAPPAEKKG
jgi:hypothetical protein